MRNVDRGFAVDKAVELAVNLILRNGVKRRCRLVKDYDRSVLVKRTGDSHFLLFAARKLNAVIVELLEHHRISALGERVYLVEKPRLAEKLIDRFAAVLFAEENVVLRRECKQLEVLENDRKKLHILIVVIVTDIHAVKEDFAAVGIVKTAQKLDEGRFSCAVKSDDKILCVLSKSL